MAVRHWIFEIGQRRAAVAYAICVSAGDLPFGYSTAPPQRNQLQGCCHPIWVTPV